MSITNAESGWLAIVTAAIWAAKGIGAVIAGRRQTTTPRRPRQDRAQKWQWLALAALQVVLGVWFLTGPSRDAAVSWLLEAGIGALLVWMIITDIGPWLRSRLNGSSKRAPS